MKVVSWWMSLSTREKLEIAVKARPDRYIVLRDEDTNELIEVHDRDTGYMWKCFFENGEEHWFWID
jgi:hypothetical protein